MFISTGAKTFLYQTTYEIQIALQAVILTDKALGDNRSVVTSLSKIFYIYFFSLKYSIAQK